MSELCEKCLAIYKNPSRGTKPHDDLEAKEYRPCKTMFGRVPEQDYVCRTCGKEWTHETGSYGCGWL